MNTTLTTILTVTCICLPAFAARLSDRSSRSGSGQSSSTTRAESTPSVISAAPTPRYEAPVRAAPAPTPRYDAPLRSAPAPTPRYEAPVRSAPAPTPRYEAPVRSAPAPAPRYEAPLRSAPAPAPRYEAPVVRSSAPAPAPREVAPVVRSAPETKRIFSTPERTYTPSQSVRKAPVTRQPEQAPSPEPQRETQQRIMQTQRPVRDITTPAKKMDGESPSTDRVTIPLPPSSTQRVATPAREPRTLSRETPRILQSTPTRTDARSTDKTSSPFIVSDRTRTSRERVGTVSSTTSTQPGILKPAQQQAVSLRSPTQSDHRTYGNDQHRTSYSSHNKPAHCAPPKHHNSYYSHHYPSHSSHNYHHSHGYHYSEGAFWTAFGLTLGAAVLAPAYVGPVYTSASYTTAWHGGAVTVSVGGPAYSYYSPYYRPYYRPYYCNTGYIHDGWHHSSAYYGGWRCNWYGGFSYMFNPYPVYRTYYLYEEPQTIVIEQPAQQVVYVNQPTQQLAPAQESVGSYAPQQQLVTPPLPAEEQQVENDPDARCFCACKCNGRVPCICEYACGSEFAYSPEEYTLKGFASYSESLNAELIWSSYAGLDRVESEAFVAGAAD